MMLCKLSLKNIKKSFKDYAIYFFTLILGVAIFYVFNAIESQTVLMNLTSSKLEIIGLMNNMLSGVSVFVSFILGFLIIYASRFLMKRRHKEFGLYMILGMSKNKISRILLLETFFIGIISLFIGLGLGAVLSQVMSLLVANMFAADMTNFSFVFSTSAMIKTMIYFGIIYFIVMIFNATNVNRCNLIDLLQAKKKSETVKMKNPYLCIIIFLIGATMLGISYYLVTAGIGYLDTANKIFIPIIMGCIATFLVIWSLSGLVLKVVMSSKKLYFKNLNSFTLRQLSSKINTTVMSMTIICLMLFVTICVFSSAISLKSSMDANLVDLVPVDVEFTKITDTSVDTQKNSLSIEKTLQTYNFNSNHSLKDIFSFFLYKDDSLTLETSLGSVYEEVVKEVPFLDVGIEDIMKLSDYNKVATLYGNKTYTLKENEYMIIADYESSVEIRNRSLKEKTAITLGNKTYLPKYNECKDGFISISSNHINSGIFIFPDQALENHEGFMEKMIANYQGTEEEKLVTEKQVLEVISQAQNESVSLNANTRTAIYESSIGLGALVTFIGLYLGIIFLITSAAILALKELSDSSDNKERYQTLRKLGAEEKIINQSLFRQIAIFFLFPLGLAMIHSIFGIMFCDYILVTFGNQKLVTSIIITAIFLIGIYGSYFLITYFCSKNIIKDEKNKGNS